MPLVRPVTAQLVLEVLQVKPPGLAVARYDEIELAPLLDGAVHDTVTFWLPRRPETPVGADGVVAGIAGLDAADAAEVRD